MSARALAGSSAALPLLEPVHRALCPTTTSAPVPPPQGMNKPGDEAGLETLALGCGGHCGGPCGPHQVRGTHSPQEVPPQERPWT